MKSLNLIIIILFQSVSLLSQIITTNNIEPFKKTINQASTSTLVVFDVDEVLIAFKDQLFHPHHKEHIYDFCEKNYKDRWSLLEKYWSIILSSSQFRLVDEELVELFQDLQDRQIPTVALTNCGTGKVGIIENLENWRINQLKKFGLNFDQLSPFKQNLIFEGIPAKHGIPLVKEGIIFTANAKVGKGIILFKALENCSETFKKIIFIDDKMENLISVEKACQEADIDFEGFLFTKVIDEPKFVFNEKLFRFQWQTLENSNIWLSDEQALILMNLDHEK